MILLRNRENVCFAHRLVRSSGIFLTKNREKAFERAIITSLTQIFRSSSSRFRSIARADSSPIDSETNRVARSTVAYGSNGRISILRK